MEALTIHKNTFTYKLYAFSISLQENLKGESLEKDYLNEGTNLCHFMRSIVVWMPIILTFQAAAYLLPIAALTVIPWYMFGSVSASFYSIGCTGVVALIMVGICYLPQLSSHKVNVITAYVTSIKDGICPFVKWSDQ